MRVEPRKMGFDRALELEWVLANGLGGYSSSTVVGLNTRKYHGLLVASVGNLQRLVCLQKLEDAIQTKAGRTGLDCIEFGGGFVRSGGFESLRDFTRGLDHVCFVHETLEFILEKRIAMVGGRNAVVASYKTRNKTDRGISHVISPHVNCRSFHDLSFEGGLSFETKAEGNNATVSVSGHTLAFKSSNGVFAPDSIWMKNIYYRKEAERGYPAVEDSFIPLGLRVDIPAAGRRDYSVIVSFDEKSAAGKAQNRAKEKGGMTMLLSSADSFIVDVGNDRTVVAGYHWFGEWGRDAMISLPGLALVTKRLDDARSILERFLARVQGGRIMTEREGGVPVYRDYDSTLWLIDRIVQYIKYAGPQEGRRFLRKRWRTIVDVMRYYSSLEREGIIMHESGTWMDTLRRDNAVEVQALWYNALNAFERLAEFSGEKTGGINVRGLRERFESNFTEKYWNGSYLRDGIGDDSFRPNQLMALSLDYPCVGKKMAKTILSEVEKRLLTPFGLRTLDPKDGRYRGAYVGGAPERELSYHNGTVWPWLFGPYVKASVRYGGKDAARKSKKLLIEFFNDSLDTGALGSISEVFDGDAPHTPRGCVSQAWSVGEPLRAYFEDALGKRPPHENIFT